MFSENAIPFWTAVAAMAAAGSAVLAAAYTYLTYRLVQMQDQAKVVLFVKHDRERASLLSIRIENIGRDVARDIKFKTSKPIPSRAFGIEAPQPTAQAHMSDGPLIEGIPALGAGDFREIVWGQFGGLSAALGDTVIVVDYEYRSGGRELCGAGVLEVRSFFETDATIATSVAVAKSLDRIAKASEATSRGVATVARGIQAREGQV